jgi:hypothetical protein
MTHPKEDGFSSRTASRWACQKCGGEIQGWTCQGCGQVFRENDAGALVFAPMEAPIWTMRVAVLSRPNIRFSRTSPLPQHDAA